MDTSWRRTILIVEDNADLRRMFRLYLSLNGFDVFEAANGLDALRLLDGGTSPDLVILDLGLPQVSGDDVRWEIAAHAETRQIPIVIVTGSDQDLDHLHVACVLRKPVSPPDLLQSVRRCLNASTGPVIAPPASPVTSENHNGVIRTSTPRRGHSTVEGQQTLWVLTRGRVTLIRAVLIAYTDAVELEIWCDDILRRRFRFLRDVQAFRHGASVARKLRTRGFADRRRHERTQLGSLLQRPL